MIFGGSILSSAAHSRARGPGARRPAFGFAVALAFLTLITSFPASAADVSTVRGPLPPPDAVAASATDVSGYKIASGDTLDVDVFNVSTLNRTVQVDAKGNIELPLIGTMDAKGKTSLQLSNDIAARLSEKYLQSPHVLVSVKQGKTNKYTVDGAVRTPGVFELTEQLTLLQVIAKSGGLIESGNSRAVHVFRTVNRQKVAGVFNLDAIRKGKADDPAIYPADMIIVSDSQSKRMWRQVVGATPLLFIFRPY